MVVGRRVPPNEHIKAGDIVDVTFPGGGYPSYIDFYEIHGDGRDNYVPGDSCYDIAYEPVKVIAVAPHSTRRQSHLLVIVEYTCAGHVQDYIIGLDCIELIGNSNTTKLMDVGGF